MISYISNILTLNNIEIDKHLLDMWNLTLLPVRWIILPEWRIYSNFFLFILIYFQLEFLSEHRETLNNRSSSHLRVVSVSLQNISLVIIIICIILSISSTVFNQRNITCMYTIYISEEDLIVRAKRVIYIWFLINYSITL